MGSDLIFYQFSRSKVERGDFSHFLKSLYAADRLPAGRRLREMMDCVVFCIEGYDDDPREIHSIPEIRRFYSAFHDAWPYWLYFCNLDAGTLKAMVFCCLPSLTAMNVPGRQERRQRYRGLEGPDRQEAARRVRFRHRPTPRSLSQFSTLDSFLEKEVIGKVFV